MLRLAQPVALARVVDVFDGFAQQAEGLVHLLRVGDEGVRVALTVQDQDGRIDVLEVGGRRALGIQLGLFPGVAAEIFGLPARSLGIRKIGDEGENAELGHGGLEAVRPADEPVNEVAAVGGPDDGHFRPVSDAFFDSLINACQHILGVPTAQVLTVGGAEGIAVALAAPVVGGQDSVALSGPDLGGGVGREGLDSPPVRPAMQGDDERAFRAFLIVRRQGQQPLDSQPVGAFPCYQVGRSDDVAVRPVTVEVGQGLGVFGTRREPEQLGHISRATGNQG